MRKQLRNILDKLTKGAPIAHCKQCHHEWMVEGNQNFMGIWMYQAGKCDWCGANGKVYQEDTTNRRRMQ